VNQLIRPMRQCGAAVLLLDHVPHGERGRTAPIGSQRKLAMIDGCQYLVTAVTPMTVGGSGSSTLKVAKDRTGFRPQHSIASCFQFGSPR
jgi:hypothetical protein